MVYLALHLRHLSSQLDLRRVGQLGVERGRRPFNQQLGPIVHLQDGDGNAQDPCEGVCVCVRTSLCSWETSTACCISGVSGSWEYREMEAFLFPSSLYFF